MDPIASVPHTGLRAFDISPTYLGIDNPYGPYIVSVGSDRDLRVNYLIAPERDPDDVIDEEEMENPELKNAAKVLAGHTGRDGETPRTTYLPTPCLQTAAIIAAALCCRPSGA